MAGPSPISSNLTSIAPSFKNISALRIRYTVLIPKGLAQFVFNPTGVLVHSSSLLVHFRPTIPVSDLESKANWKGKASTIPSTFNAFLPILSYSHSSSKSQLFNLRAFSFFLRNLPFFPSPLILWIFSLEYLSHWQLNSNIIGWHVSVFSTRLKLLGGMEWLFLMHCLISSTWIMPST